jgi:small subunit ribosomal protein S2
VPVVSVVDTNCDPDVVDWIIPGNDDALRAIRLFTTKIAESVLEGHNTYAQSQVAEQKAADDQAIIDAGPDYVDTSAYEQYEKQEGDFVEGVVETAPAETAETPEATGVEVPAEKAAH